MALTTVSMVVAWSKRPARLKSTRGGIVMIHRRVIGGDRLIFCPPALCASGEEDWRKGQRCKESSLNKLQGLEIGVVHWL
jgi:hypothetical protein